MKFFKRTFVKVLLFIVVIAVVACGAFYAGHEWEGFLYATDPTMIQQGIEGKLDEIGELATIEYNYTNIATYENNIKFKDWNVPLTTKRFILQYDGTIKAGIEISKIRITAESGVITIKLPEVEIISHEIDESSIQVLDETRNIFNRIKLEDYATFATEQKEVCEQMAIEKGLMESARDNAEKVILNLIQSLPGISNYEIVFK